jgi:ATP-binding cassette subfamily C protein
MWEELKWVRQLLTERDLIHVRLLGALLVGTALLETVSVGAILPFIQWITDPERVLHVSAFRAIYEVVGFTSTVHFLALLSVGFLLFIIAKNTYGVFVASYQEWFLGRKTADVAKRLFCRYMKGPWTEHLRRNSAEMISTAENATGWPLTAVFLALFALVSEGMVVLCIATLLLVVEPAVTATAGLMLIGCFTVVYWRINHWVKKLSPQRVAVYNARMQALQQGLSSVKEIKILGREGLFLETYGRQCDLSARLSRAINVLQAIPKLAVETLVVGGIVIVVIVVLLQGRPSEDITAVLGLFAIAAFRLMPSLNRIVVALGNLRYCHDTLRTIYDDIHCPLQRPPAPKLSRVRALRRGIAIENLEYRYETASHAALHDVSFSIAAGESVALVGPSGSGKSTLADILLGLLPPASGRVLVDGTDIATDIEGWQRQIGYVPQSISLIDASVMENVAFGVRPEEIDEARVIEALRIARLDDLVQTLPRGLRTPVGEEGVRLSGGQRQRIGIARALYGRPAVLVLDEATSALDSGTEKEVTSALEFLRGRCTLIVIAHRLSTVRNCDRLILLREGAILDSGRFDELLARSESFRRMVQLAELLAKTSDLDLSSEV